MKNKWIIAVLIAVLAFVGVGCGTKNDSTSDSMEVSDDDTEPKEDGNITEEDNAQADSSETEGNDLTFADLATRQFEFCSGAGGWSTEFTIEKDGSFKGNYHDSDMGDIGEGYADGTMYCCVFSGHFTDLTKIDEYTYEMKLSDITYENELGDTEIVENTRYIYLDAYGLEGTDRFKVYLPGTPISKLPEDVYSWVAAANENETELTITVIENEANEYGIYSYDRYDPLSEAQTLLDSYKSSNEDIQEQLSNASTQLEMNTCAEQLYTNSDECLNSIWNVVKYNVDEDEFQEILEEQRAWIVDKEAEANEVYTEDSGSLGPTDYYLKLAELTMDRCEELVEYLK